MPSKSPAQARLMQAVAHGWKPDQITGPPLSVAEEFVQADQKRKRALDGLRAAYGPGKAPRRSV